MKDSLRAFGLLLLAVSSAAAQAPAPLATRLMQAIDTASIRADVRALAGWARVAGTPAQAASADYVLREMAAAGLDTARAVYRVWLPHPDSTVVEVLAPSGTRRLRLDEPPVPGDSASARSAWRAMNGYAGAGDVTAPVVYVNYGLADDYRVLDSLGVSVRGRIVLARYGRSFRGIKAREAERRGAVGVFLYSDPADDGYVQGDVYPAGPMRARLAVQRGSILNGEGDPTTPGWASTADARRLPDDSLEVPRIPVVPLGYENAGVILGGLDAGDLPQTWQGGLPFRYHVTGGPAVRLAVWRETGERAYKPVINTLGTLRGAERPDEVVIVGAHRDAWGPGAADNASGTASVLAAARAWGAAAREGRRPRRTLVFATWDAEEWGLIGSTEWVEEGGAALDARVIAYVNQDMMATGRVFGASGASTLQPLLREVARVVPAPGDSVSVHERWRRRDVRRLPEPPIGDMGGGSDHAPFYNHRGIASLNFGFGGPQGIYHSSYDTPDYVERFGDPGYLSHQAAARLSALLLERLGNADILPFDYAALGERLVGMAADLRTAAGDSAGALPLAALARAVEEVRAEGTKLRDALAHGRAARLDAAGRERLNRALVEAERAFVRDAGIAGRPWMRNLLWSTSRNDGYANTPFPGATEAIEDRDWARARAEVADLTSRAREVARRLREGRRGL